MTAGGGPGGETTVAALATAPGRSAIALVRLTGPDAFAIAGRVVRPWPVAPRRPTLRAVHDPEDGRLLDRALVTAFPAPRSYTGEDVVELATHGGHLVPTAVLAALVAAGARPAPAGEFTRRAVLHGRLDLVQAEAVGDLIDARSSGMQAAALAQLDGGLSRRVLRLRERLLDLEALVAYDIDFPEEDAGPLARARVAEAAEDVVAQVDALLATAPAATILRDGAPVVVAGPPNAGKSSLFNALLGARRAIVTDIAGTTRDAIEAVLDARPWPLRLVDTAGLREAADPIERLGIEASEEWLGRAAVVLACGETEADVVRTEAHVRRLTDAPVVRVLTKRDGADGSPAVERARGGPPPAPRIAPPGATAITMAPPAGASDRDGHDAPDEHDAPVAVSAETGRGLAALLERVQDAVGRAHAAPADVPLVTRARHRHALGAARAELAEFAEAWRTDALPAPVAAVHLRAAVGALDDLIGAVDVDEVLGRVFATFCVGK